MQNPTLKSYAVGFVLSVILTLVPYFLVVNHLLSSTVLLATILGFAVIQLIVQLLFFLHIAKESKPRWNLIVLLSFVSIILIIVVGSLWIMYHLNYSMTPIDRSSYMLKEEGMPDNY